jgi:hypothetical protein
MAEKRLDIRTLEDLSQLKLDNTDLPEVIVFHTSLKLPIIKPNDVIRNIRVDPKLTFNIDEMPYRYRKKYIHPNLFNLAFVQDEARKKFTALTHWLKQKNNKAIFLVDTTENSVLNACSYLGDVFWNCKNPPLSTSKDFTNIPYPLKISTFSEQEPDRWIWSCYCPDALEGRLSDIDDLPDGDCLFEFPKYSDRSFPVKIIEKTNEGVIAFSVAIGGRGGEAVVIPPNLLEEYLINIKFSPDDNIVTLYVEDLPEELSSSGKREYVKLRIKYGEIEEKYSEVNLFNFLRFLVVFYASQNGREFLFKTETNNKTLKELKMKENDKIKSLHFDFLFKNKHYTADSNFLKTLKETIRGCIIPKMMNDDVAEKIFQLVCGRPLEGGNRQKTAENFFYEKLKSLQILFSDDAMTKLFNLKFPDEVKDTRISELKKRYDGFKTTISSVIQAK